MRESLERVGRFDPGRARERLRQTFAPEESRLILKEGETIGFYTSRAMADGFHLDHLYVLPEFQSQGVGASVMKHLVAEADEKGTPILVGALKESASNRFYQRHGFVQTDESEWDIYYTRAPHSMNLKGLMLTQLALEGIGFDKNNRLVRVPSPQPDDIPRFYVAHVGSDWLRFCRYDVPEDQCAHLNRLLPSQITSNALAEIAGLEDYEIWQGRSYVFPKLVNVISDFEIRERDGAFCVLIEAEEVCRAWSSREDQYSAELAVETVEACRKKGYAKAAASAWAAAITDKGKVGFYSHRKDNLPSGALARSLGVMHFMDVISYS